MDSPQISAHTAPHPTWPEIQALLVSPSPSGFIQSCISQTHDLQGNPIFPGWAFKAVILAPEGSIYGAHHPTYTINIHVPRDYPQVPPTFLWQDLTRHSQVSDLGHVSEDVLDWNPSKTIVDGLAILHDMLIGPVATKLTKEEIEHMWRHHNPHCTCSVMQTVTISFEDYCTLSYEEKLAVRNAIQAAVDEEDVSTFHRMANMALVVNKSIAKWAERSTFPELYSGVWKDEWFAPSFLQAVRGGTRQHYETIFTQEARDVFSFDMLAPEFCERLLQEFVAYEASDLPRERPNSMNNYGLVLNDIGLHSTFTTLMERFLQPIVRLFFDSYTQGYAVDCHHTFMVQYMQRQDLSLDMHSDDSEVTFNVNICDRFVGSGLVFCGAEGRDPVRLMQSRYAHRLGRAVVHAGQHRHGAEQLSEGQRYNIIVWCRAAQLRLAGNHRPHPREEQQPPDVVCLSRTHDRDFAFWEQHYRPKGPSQVQIV